MTRKRHGVGRQTPGDTPKTPEGIDAAEIRKRAGIQQKELYLSGGLSRATIDRIEHGAPASATTFVAYLDSMQRVLGEKAAKNPDAGSCLQFVAELRARFFQRRGHTLSPGGWQSASPSSTPPSSTPPSSTPTGADGPIYLCVDVPTGRYHADHRAEIWHSHHLPDEYIGAVTNVVLPIIEAVGIWWVDNVLGTWVDSKRREAVRAVIGSHLSETDTGFYLIPQKNRTTRTHPLHGQIVALLCFSGCRTIDSHSLARLKEDVLKAHVDRALVSVKDNTGVYATADKVDIFSRAAALAAMIKRALEQ